MKVLGFNGSPRKDGNTHLLLQTVFCELEKSGIETEEINIGTKAIKGCTGCMKCAENIDGYCIIKKDPINDYINKMRAADGLILGSPVYCADLTGQMKTFIDRTSLVAAVNDDLFKRKVGASVVAVRRAGGQTTFNSMNAFFTISQMITVGSTYWNIGYGMEKGEASQDEEGLQTMHNLGKNMAWLMKSIEIARNMNPEPDSHREILTNFIR